MKDVPDIIIGGLSNLKIGLNMQAGLKTKICANVFKYMLCLVVQSLPRQKDILGLQN